MSEDFLSRWSRRKQAAQEAAKTPAATDTPPVAERTQLPVSESQSVSDAAAKPDPELDLSTLPSLESITATTDVTAFLRKGVPLALSRAALRRAWTADPTIRDFVGLAENAWDFNDPTAMEGFGPLDQTPEQVRALVDRIVGGVRRVAEAAEEVEVTTSNPPVNSEASQPMVAAGSTSAKAQPSEAAPADEQLPPAGTGSEAATPEQEPPAPAEMVRRTHGGALPR